MSLTREQLERIYWNAHHIHTQSRLPDVRRKAKEIATLVEKEIPATGRTTAEDWKD